MTSRDRAKFHDGDFEAGACAFECCRKSGDSGTGDNQVWGLSTEQTGCCKEEGNGPGLPTHLERLDFTSSRTWMVAPVRIRLRLRQTDVQHLALLDSNRCLTAAFDEIRERLLVAIGAEIGHRAVRLAQGFHDD